MASIEDALAEESSLESTLEVGYQDLDETQPALAEFLSTELGARKDELAQSLGYFLIVSTYLAFKYAFAERVGTIDQQGLNAARETLETDEELRRGDPDEVMESDDVLAMGQPALLEFIQTHVGDAVNMEGESVDLEELDHVYRVLLVEVIALSHAIQAPDGPPSSELPGSEVLA